MKLLLMFLFLLVSNAYADSIDLNKITVTPFRYEESLEKSPAQVTVITQEQIERSNATRLVDVLRPVGGIVVRDLYGNGTQSAIDMGGFGEQAALNVLVLVDGRRANNPDLSGTDLNQIPINQIERVEIIHGGWGGSLYGDNASGGVVNIITKKGHGNPSGQLTTSYSSYDTIKNEVSLKGSMKKRIAYWLNANRESSNGYRDNGYNKESNFASKLSYDVNDNVNVHVSSGFKVSSYGLPGAVYEANIDRDGRKATRYPKDHVNNKNYYFLAGVDNDFDQYGKVSIDATFKRDELDSFYLSSGLYPRKNRVETVGFTPKYTLKHDILDMENKLIVGSDVYRTDFRSRNFDTADDRIIQNITSIHKNSIAGYIQDQLKVIDPLMWVNGYRYETTRYGFNYHDFSGYNPDIESKQKPHANLYNTGLVYTYADDSNIYGNINRSFRFPQVDEFTYQDASFQQQLNTSLKPQSSINYQIGITHKFADRLKASAMLYRMNVRNELYFNAAGGPTGFGQNENYDKTVHQGFDIAPTVKVADWMNVTGDYMYTQAYFDGGLYHKNEIPMVPRHKASLGTQFILPSHLTLNVNQNFVGQRYFLNDQANVHSKLNDYMTTDTNVSWAYSDWVVTFGVNNVFDKKYAEYGGVRLTAGGGFPAGTKFYYPSPERNYNMKVDYKF